MSWSIQAKYIFLESIPVLLMIALIPFVAHDAVLVCAYMGIIVFALFVSYKPKDWLFLLIGFCFMTLSEYFFIATGVEVFQRRSFLGVMPVWLPVLWAYGFVAIRRAIAILEQ
jgi:hypothetical protein